MSVLFQKKKKKRIFPLIHTSFFIRYFPPFLLRSALYDTDDCRVGIFKQTVNLLESEMFCFGNIVHTVASDFHTNNPHFQRWERSGKHRWYADRKQTTIWEFEKTKKNTDHPTMKPIPLLAYPIQNSSMSNTLILDPFGGSGSTLIACEQTDRDCYTIELDEKYCDVIVTRYIEQVGSADSVSVERDGKTYTFAELEVSDE